MSSEERDRWVRLFNRLEVAITHHKRDTGQFTTDADDRLYAARDKIVLDSTRNIPSWLRDKGL